MLRRTGSEIVFGTEDLDSDEPIVTSTIRPSRIAITRTEVYVRRSPDGFALLLADPDPKIWNTWMFPFSSIVIDAPREFTPGMTPRSVVGILTEISMRAEEPRTSDSGGTLLHEDYAIRFSQSATCWS